MGNNGAGIKTRFEMTEKEKAITRIAEWAGSPAFADAWYRSYSIPALGGKTAEQVIDEGNSKVVHDYLDHMALGGYA